MATNKHAIIRYRVIDQCLRNLDGKWNWRTLADACAQQIESSTGDRISLSERTIKGDIHAMRNDERLGYFAPIEYDRKEKSYYYTDRRYSITEAPLNKSDSKELKRVISLLRQFTGFKHLEGIDNIIHKLELMVYESVGESKQIVQLEQSVSIPGQKWLDAIYEAIKLEYSITIRYQPFERKPYSTSVSPYLLKEHEGRWYLIAYSHDKEDYRTYGLERIKEVRKSLATFIHPENFNPEEYYRDIIGITLLKNKKKSLVEFEAFGYLIPFLKTQAIHHSQKTLEENKQSAKFSLELIINNELENQFLSYGEFVKIKSPKTLRNRLIKRLEAASNHYK